MSQTFVSSARPDQVHATVCIASAWPRMILLHVAAGTFTFSPEQAEAVLEVMSQAVARLHDPEPLPRPEPKPRPEVGPKPVAKPRLSLNDALEF